MREKWTANDVPEQQGRVAVITGANSGIGFEAAKILAARGASVVLAVRDVNKGRQAAARIAETVPGANVTVQSLDLASLDSIRSAATEIQAKHPRIDLLINNAGVLYTPKLTTRDGFELQFGTNHLGHFAFTGLLLNAMLPVPGSRVITVSSMAHRGGAGINFDDLQWEKSYDRMEAYRQSKLANLLFTYELQRRLSASNAKTISVAAHPGLARTNIMRNSPLTYRAFILLIMPLGLLIAQSAAMGALPTLRAATDPNVQGGQYYGPNGRWLHEFKGHPKLVKSSDYSHDINIQRRLWTVSEELTGIKFPV
jgi:NAD(P)-dependent dehydrogenase (short-subunit alcohol dehydrogenase family)